MLTRFDLSFLLVLVFTGLCLSFTGSQREENTFTDARDENSYAWVEINGLLWMAENLRYESPGSDCYEDDTRLCQSLGRLYPYSDLAGICPDGWRLPNKSDWKSLKKAMKSSKADKILMPGTWEGKDFAGANNQLGLSVLPAGRKDGNVPEWRESQYGEIGISATFWLDDPGFEEHWHIRWGKSHTHRHGDLRQQKRKFSIRCVCESLPEQ